MVLELSDFSLRVDERLVADQVNLRLPAKGLVVLTGERGSGKTALLRCLAGFDLRGQADVGGAITLEGRPAARDELRSVAAYVSEQAPPLSDSVRDNLVSGIADWRELGYPGDPARHGGRAQRGLLSPRGPQ